MLTKYCSCCKETKDISLFSVNKTKYDGLQINCKECNRATYLAKKEQLSKYYKEYNQIKKDDVREQKRLYRSLKPQIQAASRAKRRASKLQATPDWADLEAVKGMYQLAALFNKTGINLHVDHVVPLQGDTVCGLHCEDNLQLIPASSNCSKGNRHWPDMW